MMHPIERLRYVARAGDEDPALLAEEAAVGLASLAVDPRTLVPSARRLIDSHPSCGPMWWVGARLSVAADLRAEAQRVIDELYDDPTPEELAAAFAADAVVASGFGRLALTGISLRPDLDVRVVAGRRKLAVAMRLLEDHGHVEGHHVEELDDALEGAHLVVVQVLAAGPTGCVLDPASATLAQRALARDLPIWAVAGVGELLAPGLFEALVAHTRAGSLEDVGDDDEEDEELEDEFRYGYASERDRPVVFLPTGALSVVVGRYGVSAALPGLKKTDCPDPIELRQWSR